MMPPQYSRETSEELGGGREWSIEKEDLAYTGIKQESTSPYTKSSRWLGPNLIRASKPPQRRELVLQAHQLASVLSESETFGQALTESVTAQQRRDVSRLAAEYDGPRRSPAYPIEWVSSEPKLRRALATWTRLAEPFLAAAGEADPGSDRAAALEPHPQTPAPRGWDSADRPGREAASEERKRPGRLSRRRAAAREVEDFMGALYTPTKRAARGKKASKAPRRVKAELDDHVQELEARTQLLTEQAEQLERQANQPERLEALVDTLDRAVRLVDAQARSLRVAAEALDRQAERLAAVDPAGAMESNERLIEYVKALLRQRVGAPSPALW
ncbi:hypothetical protein CDD83_1781 [Cordyceps sp. RAO-2017]|nr:hypothetical protein CDD83_1781 [Cordyceps sp. RAO-2017]